MPNDRDFATLPSRMMAFFIDCLVCGGGAVLVLVLIAWIQASTGHPDGKGVSVQTQDFLTYLVRGLFVVGPILYFAVLEGALRRMTVGKKMAGIEVVRTNTRSYIGFPRALIRTLIKLGSIFSVIGAIVQVAVILSSPSHAGLHDRVCDSEVVVSEPD